MQIISFVIGIVDTMLKSFAVDLRGTKISPLLRAVMKSMEFGAIAINTSFSCFFVSSCEKFLVEKRIGG